MSYAKYIAIYIFDQYLILQQEFFFFSPSKLKCFCSLVCSLIYSSTLSSHHWKLSIFAHHSHCTYIYQFHVLAFLPCCSNHGMCCANLNLLNHSTLYFFSFLSHIPLFHCFHYMFFATLHRHLLNNSFE